MSFPAIACQHLEPPCGRCALPTHTIVCDLGAVDRPGLATLDALCRLRASVSQRGAQVRLRNVPSALGELIELAGLSDVLPLEESGLEPGRKAKQREEPDGVQEEGDPGDAIA
jgi:anti-anti-sigma regulatory factor